MKAYKVYSITRDCVSSKNEQAEPDIINFEKYFKNLEDAKNFLIKYYSNLRLPLVYKTNEDGSEYSFYFEGKGYNGVILLPLNAYIKEIEVEE